MAVLSGVFIVLAGTIIPTSSFIKWFFLLGACVFLFGSGFFDMLDGHIARQQNSSTIFGGFLDSVLDRYSDAILVIALILGGFCNLYFGLIALIGCILVSYSRARAESSGVESKYMAAGIAERMERLILVGICMYMEQGLFLLDWLFRIPLPPAGFWPFTNPVAVAIIILSIITHVTVVHRIYIAYTRLPHDKLSMEDYKKKNEEIQNNLKENPK